MSDAISDNESIIDAESKLFAYVGDYRILVSLLETFRTVAGQWTMLEDVAIVAGSSLIECDKSKDKENAG